MRKKVLGRTKQEVRQKFKAMHAELDAGLLNSLIEWIGPKPLRDLTVQDVRAGLEALAPRFSTRSQQITASP